MARIDFPLRDLKRLLFNRKFNALPNLKGIQVNFKDGFVVVHKAGKHLCAAHGKHDVLTRFLRRS
jgi:hypothetical protein